MKRLIRYIEDIYGCFTSGEADEVVLHTENFKHAGLYPHALKYSLWTTKPEGIVTIRDSGPLHSHGWINEVPFAIVRYWTAKLVKDYGTIVAVDEDALTLTVRRTEKRTGADWALGIIASGAPGEAEILDNCISSALQVSSLERNNIFLCGPETLRIVAEKAGISFVSYQDESDKTSTRFMISAKKNFLIKRMRASKLAVIHSRILLQPQTLNELPDEFDAISPTSYVLGRSGLIRYLDLAATDLMLPGIMPSRRPRSTRNEAGSHLRLMAFGRPYIDGSMMFFRREVWEICPLDSGLAWGEFEDVEWAMRLWANGFLVDVSQRSRVVSQTTKLPNGDSYAPHLRGVIKRAYGMKLYVMGYVRYWRRSLRTWLHSRLRRRR